MDRRGPTPRRVGAIDRRLLRAARATAAYLGIAVALGLIAVGLAIAQAWFIASAVSAVFLERAEVEAIGPSLGALAMVLAGRAGLAVLQEAAAHRASASVKAALRRRILERAIRSGSRTTVAGGGAEVLAVATRGVDALDAYFARYLPQVVLAVIVPTVVVVALVAVDVVSGITVALTIPIIVIFMVLVGRAAEGHRLRRWTALTRLASHFLDVVAGLTTLKVFGRSRAQVDTLVRITDAYRRESMAALRIAFLSAFALEFFATLSVALVAVGIGLRLVDGELDLRTGLFVLVLAPEAYLPLRQLGLHFHASGEGRAASTAAFAIIDAPECPAGSRTDPPDFARGLRIEGVSIRQPGRDLVAPDRADLAVEPGKVVAIVGASGAGKTSLLLAVLGLVPVDAGRIVAVGADGVEAPSAGFAPRAWLSRIAWVPQHPFLFPGTVAMNVRLACPEASDDSVRAALDEVGLVTLSLEAPVGEHGRGLSSGEARRVAVARALLVNAPLLLLDEPTAGLDDVSEELVLTAVRAAARNGAAVLRVAHRPAAAAAADRVVHVEWRAAA